MFVVELMLRPQPPLQTGAVVPKGPGSPPAGAFFCVRLLPAIAVSRTGHEA